MEQAHDLAFPFGGGLGEDVGRTQEWTWPRATLWKALGEHRVNLVAGAQVLIERERFDDSYMRLPAGA